MAIGREQRMQERRLEVERIFSVKNVDTVIQLLTLLEFAWHDCYNEVTPPDDVISDVLAFSKGDIALLVRAAHLAMIDRRDLHVAVHGN
jgi:hypothetical protein